ncbi:MAG TPA: hypothetical protein VLR71_07670 [Casimicrobiaceae bacterium]|nr:hypothetical protein [Casimicrobiaceae bacterium]
MATPASDFAQGMTNDAGNDTPDAMGTTAIDAGTGAQDAGRTVGRTGNRAREGMDDLATSAQDAASSMGDAANEYVERASATGAQLLDDARDYIGAYPLRSIGIAAAAGYLLMRMLR